ncbi:Crp/Fnr family transcriptional regulator [Paenibacillus algorifonticola]|nr:helix-turn-helix domain-containing protein [Paenibacillus algorifonticola]
MSQLTQHLALGNLHDKILHALMRLGKDFGLISAGEFDKINFPLSHQEIAHLVGASRESVTIALQELAKEGFISTGFRTVCIHKGKLLERPAT